VTLGRADPARTAGGANAACTVGGPWFEELEVGQVFADAPALPLTEGGGGLAHLRARLQVVDETDQRRDALDWRFVAAPA
jgi:hypothetical protein